MYKLELDNTNPELASEARVIEYAKNRLIANSDDALNWLNFERAKFYIGEIVGDDFDNWNNTQDKGVDESNYGEFFEDIKEKLYSDAAPQFIIETVQKIAKEIGAYLTLEKAIEVIHSYGEDVIDIGSNAFMYDDFDSGCDNVYCVLSGYKDLSSEVSLLTDDEAKVTLYVRFYNMNGSFERKHEVELDVDFHEDMDLEYEINGEYLYVTLTGIEDKYQIHIKNQIEGDKGVVIDAYKNDESYESLGYILAEDVEQSQQERLYTEESSIGDIHCVDAEVNAMEFKEYKNSALEHVTESEDGSLQVTLNDYFDESDYEGHDERLAEHIKEALSLGAEILYIKTTTVADRDAANAKQVHYDFIAEELEVSQDFFLEDVMEVGFTEPTERVFTLVEGKSFLSRGSWAGNGIVTINTATPAVLDRLTEAKSERVANILRNSEHLTYTAKDCQGFEVFVACDIEGLEALAKSLDFDLELVVPEENVSKCACCNTLYSVEDLEDDGDRFICNSCKSKNDTE